MARRRCLAALTTAHCWHCPTSAPVAREPLGSLLTWISLLSGLCLLAGCSHRLRGPCPAVFLGNPRLRRLQGGPEALEVMVGKQKYLPPTSSPPGQPHLAGSPASPLRCEFSMPVSPLLTLQGSSRPWEKGLLLSLQPGSVLPGLWLCQNKPFQTPLPSYTLANRAPRAHQALCQA